MLSPTAKKFAEAWPGIVSGQDDHEHLLRGYEIAYGNWSSRWENGIRQQDARLLLNGKAVGFYDAATGEVYS